jgi:general secretion pathway protein B
MSYILDALRKAEEERGLGQTPQAKTVYGSLPARQHRSWAKLLLGLLLLLNGAALSAFFFLSDNGKALLSGDLSTSAASQAASTESANPSISLPPREFHNQATVIEKTPPSPRMEQKISPQGLVSAASSNTLSAIETSPTPDPAVPSTPSWQNPQNSIPHLNLDIHVYDRTQQKSFVVINSVRYQTGERLKEGPNLESITEDGAVLSYAGQRFRLSVGE